MNQNVLNTYIFFEITFGYITLIISSAAIWFFRNLWMIVNDILELWISSEHSTNDSWVMVLTKNRPFHSKKGGFFIFSMIWYNHTFGQICLLKRTFSQMIDVVPGPFVSKFHEILMQFDEYISFRFQAKLLISYRYITRGPHTKPDQKSSTDFTISHHSIPPRCL